MNSFTTFIPIRLNGRKLSLRQIGNVFWIIATGACIPAYLTGDKFLKVVFYSVFLFGATIKVLSLFAKKPKRTIDGTITFETERIIINEVRYDLAEITKLEFTDYKDFLRKGESFSGDKKDWPNGKDVGLSLRLKEGNDVVKYLQLTHRKQMQDVRPQLVHYHNSGKLHFLNLIDILGIEDYNAIQIFKNSLSEGGGVKSY